MMQPGPELDRLIAEKVMGWKLSDNQHFYGIAHNMAGPDKMIRLRDHWQPSVNIAHAMEVAEDFAGGPGMWFEVSIDHDSMHEDGAYLARASDPEGWAGITGKPIEARAETMAHAICLAALKAYGVDV